MRKRYFLLGLLITQLFLANLFAKNLKVIWSKTYGGDEWDRGFSVEQTEDGGYIIAGWTKSFGADTDVYLIKTDPKGDISWTKTYGGNEDDKGYSVEQTEDGGYIIAGWTKSFGAGNNDVYLIKADSKGDTQWVKTFGGAEFDEGYSVRQTKDNGYIIVGKTNSFGTENDDVYLIRTDSEGKIIWSRTYGGNYFGIGRSVKQTTDNGFIVAGWIRSLSWVDNDVYLIKTDSKGDTLWSRNYGGDGYNEGYLVIQTQDGEYIVVGETSSRVHFGKGGDDVYALKVNNKGDSVWAKAYGGEDDDYGWSVIEVSDDEFILAGWTRSFDGGGGDVFLIKIDKLGDILWKETHGVACTDRCFSISKTSEDGFIAVGERELNESKTGKPNFDVLLIRYK